MDEGSVRIDRRFRGPPTSGNGGYCAGLLGAHLAGAVEVTLRAPPPLERDLRFTRTPTGAALLDGDQVVAEARAVPLALEVPAPPRLSDARAWSLGYTGFASHIFPGCFVCGPARGEGDGLRIFAGRSPEGTLVGAPFLPDASLAGGVAGAPLPVPVAWAALDCPGYFAVGNGEAALLGRMTAEWTRLPVTGARYVILGWPLGREGRKLHAGTALFDEAGALLGRSRQTWLLTPAG